MHPGRESALEQRDGAALPGAQSGGGRVLTERPGESAEGSAPARRAGLPFEPDDGSQAYPGLIGQFFLRQAALPAQLAQSLAVENECLRLAGSCGFAVGPRRGSALTRSHSASISYHTVHPACSSPLRPKSRAKWATTRRPRPFWSS